MFGGNWFYLCFLWGMWTNKFSVQKNKNVSCLIQTADPGTLGLLQFLHRSALLTILSPCEMTQKLPKANPSKGFIRLSNKVY